MEFIMSITTDTAPYPTEIGNESVIDFGTKKKGENVETTVFLKGENITQVNTTAGCSCTIPTPTRVDDNTYKVHIKYKNTHVATPFSIRVQISYKENEVQKNKIVRIKGNITN